MISHYLHHLFIFGVVMVTVEFAPNSNPMDRQRFRRRVLPESAQRVD